MNDKRKAALPLLRLLKQWDANLKKVHEQYEEPNQNNPIWMAGNYDDLVTDVLGETLDYVVHYLLDHPLPSDPQVKHFHDKLALGDYYTEGFFIGVCSGYMSEEKYIDHADWCLEYMKKHNDEPIIHFNDDDTPDDAGFYRWFGTGQHLIEGEYFDLDLSES